MYDVGRPPRLLNERYRGLWASGLGAEDPTEGGECLEPVHFTERDALRNEIKAWTNPHERKHFVENHPDIGLVYDDIVGRLHGLEMRPKLLRCSKEARTRASRWIAQLNELGRKVRPTFPKAGATYVPATFQFTVFRGPTYTIRSTREQIGRSAAPPSAPPGSVVIDGVTYPSSAAAAAATATTPPSSGAPAPSEPGTLTPTTGLPVALPSLEGSVGGVPTKYLLYGALALLAFRMMMK